MSMDHHTRLRAAIKQGEVRALDYQFARFVVDSEHQADNNQLLFWSAFLLSRESGRKHVCVDLRQYATTSLAVATDVPTYRFPALDAWRSTLLACRCVSHGPEAEQATPLILDGDRLYLARYWAYEQQVAQALFERAQPAPIADVAKARAQLDALFGTRDHIDWQKVAAAVALSRRFSVISGGPGTGKTTTVTRLLALLLQQAEQPEQLSIRLSAPTGKAAVRLTESIRGAKAKLPVDDAIRALIPEQATTLHRLLGAKPDSVAFPHHADNPLHCDMLVLDEASMIDLPLMAKLLDALPQHCRLILLGDKDQLASVEAGSVLGDICSDIRHDVASLHINYSPQAGQQLQALTGFRLAEHINPAHRGIGDSLCLLQESYRFAGGIGELAKAVNEQRPLVALALLSDANVADVSHYAEPASAQHQLVELATHEYSDYIRSIGDPPEQVLRRFDQFRVLCASRSGTLGVVQLNEAIERALQQRGAIQASGEFYPGRPVMISKNDYSTRLFNGDTGIVLPSPGEPQQLRVYFLQADNTVRAVQPSRLPAHETAYAMTVHKSQGSEFRRVALVLPAQQSDKLSTILTKELVYTGITRAKEHVHLFAGGDVLTQAIGQRTERASGLADRLKR